MDENHSEGCYPANFGILSALIFHMRLPCTNPPVLSFSVALRRFGRQTPLRGGCASDIGLHKLRNLRKAWLENDRPLHDPEST